MSIRIAPLTPEYYDSNLRLLNTAVQESHFLARRREILREEGERFMETYRGNPNFLYLVALKGAEVVGHAFALPRIEDMIGHIANIGYLVARPHRGQGLCSTMIETLISEAKDRTGLEILFAEVAEDNVVSLAVLRKFRFTEIGRLRRGLKKETGDYLDLILHSRPVVLSRE